MDRLSQEKLELILSSFRKGVVELLGEKVLWIYLYGSQARGDSYPGSDIDLLVVIDGDFDYADLLNRTLDLTAQISLEHDVVISKVFVSEEHFNRDNTPFLLNVRREAIAI